MVLIQASAHDLYSLHLLVSQSQMHDRFDGSTPLSLILSHPAEPDTGIQDTLPLCICYEIPVSGSAG